MKILPYVEKPTSEQLKLIGDRRPGFRIIRGAAGTGKTTIALQRLKELTTVRLWRRQRYEHEAPVRVLVLTFNRTLEGYITELARKSMPNEDALELKVSTFARWARSLIIDPKIADSDQTYNMLQSHLQKLSIRASHNFLVDEVEYILGRFSPNELSTYLTVTRIGRGTSPRVDQKLREILLIDTIPAYTEAKAKAGVIDWNDLAIYAANTKPDIRYDIVVIDEAQDFSANQVRAVLRHLQDSHTTTFILDGIQRIYQRGFTWSEVGIQVRPEMVCTLKENHRNTIEIAAFAYVLVSDLSADDDNSRETLPDFKSCKRSGQKPLVLIGKFSDQLRFMLKNLSQAINQGTESVAILHPLGGGWFDETRRVLNSLGISFCELTGRNEWPSGSEVVALSTMQSAKGLEFDNVLIPGLNQEVTSHGPGDHDTDRDRLRRMLAMAIGRARETVMIGYKPGEESSLISLLDPSTYELVVV